MLAAIQMTGTRFCSSPDGVDHPVAELLYAAVMAGIFIFDILNVAEGRTWPRSVVQCYRVLIFVCFLCSVSKWIKCCI